MRALMLTAQGVLPMISTQQRQCLMNLTGSFCSSRTLRNISAWPWTPCRRQRGADAARSAWRCLEAGRPQRALSTRVRERLVMKPSRVRMPGHTMAGSQGAGRWQVQQRWCKLGSLREKHKRKVLVAADVWTVGGRINQRSLVMLAEQVGAGFFLWRPLLIEAG